MTASRAINQPALVAPDTAARVRAAAERLAYVTNRIAGGLSSRKSRIVIAVIPSTLNPVFAEMVEALRTDLLRADYLLLERLDGTGARPKARQILDVGSRLIAREST